MGSETRLRIVAKGEESERQMTITEADDVIQELKYIERDCRKQSQDFEPLPCNQRTIEFFKHRADCMAMAIEIIEANK